jgi:tetratricopeptide (TPR) repeat protein
LETVNSVVYEAIREFRDAVFEKLRSVTRQSHGAKYITELKAVVGQDRWEASLRSAKQLRSSRIITTPLIDDFDAQDISDLPKLLEKFYEKTVAVKGEKAELSSALTGIAEFRNGVAHPSFFDVSIDDARRLGERILSASILIFGDFTKEYGLIRDAVNRLFEYKPPAATPFIKILPPRQEVVGQFVGKERDLRTLYSWLDSSIPLWILEGDGGKGKSSLAYVFCESLERSNGNLERIIWISAKTRKFVEGNVALLQPDFTDLLSAFQAIIVAYGFGDSVSQSIDEMEKLATDLLQSSPALIVLDDIDSLEREHENVHYWFTNTLQRKAFSCKALLTTRRGLYGLGSYTTQIRGLTFDETKRFLRNASDKAYNNADKLSRGTLPKLAFDATEGSPLYLEDLTRLILVTGKQPDLVIAEWKSVRHDVREYALKREFELLHSKSKEVLLATALADSPISRTELLSTCGLSDSELEIAIDELQKFFLISNPDIEALTPTFEINRNLGILVKTVMANHEDFRRIANALKQIRDTSGKQHRVARDAQQAIREAVAFVSIDQHPAAETLLRKFLEKYPDEGSLLSHLGWVLSRWPDRKRQTEAESYFQRAVDVRHRNLATYSNLCSLYYRQHNLAGVVKVATAGLELYPDDSDLLFFNAYAGARVVLDEINRTEFISGIAKDEAVAKIQFALRSVMKVVKRFHDAGEAKSLSSETKLLNQIDAELRSEIDSLRVIQAR